MWCHTLSRAQMSAIASSGSTAPVLVVPALETTAKGTRPARRSASMAASRRSVLSLKHASDAIGRALLRRRLAHRPAQRSGVKIAAAWLARQRDDVIDAAGDDRIGHGAHLIRRVFEVYWIQSFTR